MLHPIITCRITCRWTGVLIGLTLVAGCGGPSELGRVADPSAAKSIRATLVAASGGGADAGTSAPVGTGWASLKGRFVFDGPPPVMAPYGVNKDQATCAPGGQAPLQQTLVVDSGSGGIKNVAIYLRKASRVHESAQPSDNPIDFDQKTCVFLTHVTACAVGQPLLLKNSDPVGHNTNIAGKKNTFNQTIPAGETIPFIPQKEEAAPAKVTCSIHPWMVSYLLPRENGYFAVTAEDGSFEIANLPAGERLEIQVWHENSAKPGGGLALNSPAAKELGWNSKGRFEIQLTENETKEIEIEVPAAAFQ